MRRILVSLCRWLIGYLEPRAAHPPPSETELSENIQHVCYEYAAMERAAEVLRKGGRFRFEAFLIHARLLREFFWRKQSGRGPGASNSLLAEHYFDNPLDWRSIRGGLPRVLKTTKERIDRQVAHLARDRHREFMDLETQVQGIQAALRDQWLGFERALPARWASAFQQELEQKRQLLADNSN